VVKLVNVGGMVAARTEGAEENLQDPESGQRTRQEETETAETGTRVGCTNGRENARGNVTGSERGNEPETESGNGRETERQ